MACVAGGVMQSILIVSHIGLWLLVSCLGLAVFALSRQIGLLHRRIAPSGARMLTAGPEIGDHAPEFSAVDLEGRQVTLAARRGKLTLLVFVAPNCSTCAGLIPAVRTFARSERRHLDVALISTSKDEATNRTFARTHEITQLPFVLGADIADSYHVRFPPYAVLVGADGLVKAKGVVNHFEHLDSLMTAARLGHPTLESYLARQAGPMIPALASDGAPPSDLPSA
jgi:methylamine dehydrogenase accessory protein MauD